MIELAKNISPKLTFRKIPMHFFHYSRAKYRYRMQERSALKSIVITQINSKLLPESCSESCSPWVSRFCYQDLSSQCCLENGDQKD